MAQSLTTIDKLLKEQYLPEIVDTFQEEKGVLGEVMKRKKNGKGGDTEVLVRVGRNSGIGFRADGDDLPAAGNSSWIRHTVTPRLMYGRIQVSGPAMARTEGGSAKAFLKAFVDETKHTLGFMKKQANRALWGGKEGYLAKIASVSTTTLTLDAPGTGGMYVAVNENAGTRYFDWNTETKISVVDDSATPTRHVADLFTRNIDHSANTIQGSATASGSLTDFAAAGVAAGDYVIMYDGVAASGTTALGTHFEGIQAAVDDGSILTYTGQTANTRQYHGHDTATYDQLKAVALDNSGTLRNISESLMEDTVKTLYLNSGEDPMDGGYQWRTSLGIHSDLVAIGVSSSTVRYSNTSQRGKLGNTERLKFNGIEVVADVDAPFEAAYLIKWDCFKWIETDPLGWLDIDGRVLNRVADKDAYEARLRLYGNLICVGRHKQAVLRDLNDTAYTLRT